MGTTYLMESEERDVPDATYTLVVTLISNPTMIGYGFPGSYWMMVQCTALVLTKNILHFLHAHQNYLVVLNQ